MRNGTFRAVRHRRVLINILNILNNGPYADYSTYDTFESPDGTQMDGRAPDRAPFGGIWSESSAGKLNISSNQLVRAASGGARYCHIDMGETQQDVQATVALSANDSYAGVLFNYEDANNYAYVVLYLAASVRFYTYIASSSVLEVINTDLSLQVATPYELRVTCDGTTVSVYVDGTPLFTDVPPALPTGEHVGIMTFAGTGAIIDNFKAKKLQ